MNVRVPSKEDIRVWLKGILLLGALGAWIFGPLMLFLFLHPSTSIHGYLHSELVANVCANRYIEQRLSGVGVVGCFLSLAIPVGLLIIFMFFYVVQVLPPVWRNR